jgi:hypothetical protein
MRFLPQGSDFPRLLATIASQVLLGYFTLFIQAIYPVWSSPFWPASGAALAAVLLGGPRMIFGVYLGLLVLGFKFFWGPYPLWMAFVVPLGNLAETCLAYFLLRHFVPRFDLGFANIRQLAAFILFCPWIPAITSAVSIQLLLQAMGTVPPDRFISEVAVYSLGNATGILLLTPLILVWRDFRSFPWKELEGRKIIAVVLLLFAGLWLYYADWAPIWGRLISVAMIPLAVWGVWATGIRGATLACLLGSISYFAFDVPGARPLSSLLQEKQKSAELRFAMAKQIQGAPDMQPPPRLAQDISDQIGLLAVICITILPLGVASDELRKKAARDRLVMAKLSSSFWNWSPVTGNQIENQKIAMLFSPTTQLFYPHRKTGSLKIRPAGPDAALYLSHWLIQEADPSGNPLQVTGILQNYSIEEERDAALAQARLAELEIQTLRSHLNPHLLFNCLTGLRGLIAQDAAKAREFAGNLARFLRAVVDSENEKTIPLRQELAICEDFIRLEELRGRPLQLQVQLEDRDREVSIPPMTLVTLLENAAKHGLRRNGNPLPVTISGDRPDSNHFRLRVQQPGTLQRPTDEKNHAGLDLIRRQLEMVLGQGSHLELRQQSSGSVVASLILPA